MLGQIGNSKEILMKLLNKNSWRALGKVSIYLASAVLFSIIFDIGTFENNIFMCISGVAASFLTLRELEN